MLSVEDLNEIIIAVTGLLAATAALVAAIRQVNVRLDKSDAIFRAHTHLDESSSTKVLPPDNP